MDHNSYHHQPFNHLPQHPLYSNPPSPVHAPPPGPLEAADYHYAPASPSDFIYNSASIFHHHHSPRPSFHSSLLFSNEPVLPYPPAAVDHGGGPSRTRPVEQSFHTTYLPGLPKPAPGFEEHRRQRQRQLTMNMGPGPSKSVPPALSLGGAGERGRTSSSEETVVIKREEKGSGGSSSPVPWVSIPLGQRVKREPRMSHMKQGKRVEGDVVGYMPVGTENGMGSGSGSGSNTWEERGEGVLERVVMPVVPSVGMGLGSMETGMGMGMGMEPTIMPRMGLFKPIRWDGPSSASKAKARRVRAWETLEEGTGDVHLRRTLGTQNQNGNGNSNSNSNCNCNSNRDRNEEPENEQPATIHVASSPHFRSPKRLKTSTSVSGCIFRSGSAEKETDTVTTVNIKQEPGLSPPPSAIFARIPMYNNGTIDNTAAGDESSGQYDNSLSSRSISPLTRVPTARRVLSPTPNRTSTGTGMTSSQPSLRAVGKHLKKRNRERALGQYREESRKSGEWSRERSRERRGEGFWDLAGGSQGQTHNVSPQQQQQNRGSSEERERGWTTMISGSSEEGEVSSYYEDSYSCGQEKDRSNTHQSSPFLSPTDQEWCHPFLFSSSSSAPVPETSARYDHVSAPPRTTLQMREEQYWQQAIQMVQDTCLEASKRYIRAHCVNRGARGGGSPDTSSPLSHRSETRTVRSKARRTRKLQSRQVSYSSGSSSSSSSPSPLPAPSRRQRRRGKGKRRSRRTKKRTTTTPPSSLSSPHSHAHAHAHPQPQPAEIHPSDSLLLLPNISQICTLLWSRSQSLRLHDTDSIELHAARNMYWLLSWAETVAFAVLPPTVTFTASTVPEPKPNPDSNLFDLTTTSTSGTSSSVGSSMVPGFDGFSSSSFRHRDRKRDWDWEDCGEGLVQDNGFIWKRGRNSEGSGGFEMLESRNGRAVWEKQRREMMKRVFDEGGMLCEFLGYGEGVERLGRVREFYGPW